VIAVVALLCASLSGQNVRLSPRFRTVYILGMANALDQYLASRLTSTRVLWVVLEPPSADAVLTDTLDDAFWTWLTRTYPPAAGASTSTANPSTAFRRDTATSPHRGMVFLVDPRSRVVMWSAYQLPKSSAPSEMDHAASQITNQLKAALGRK
jgi:hypothetical protein